MGSVLCCRQQAEGSKAALQAAADTVAAISTPHKRRTTAETATQYMLGDLDSEPLTAIGHAQQRQEAQLLARLSVGTAASVYDPSGPPESALPGLHGEASAGLYGYAQTGHGHLPVGPHGHAPPGHGLKGLIQAQSQPSKAFDRGHEGCEGHKTSTHPMPDVKYSEIEHQVTEAEDEEMQRQASVMPLPAGAGPHGQQQSLSQSQPWGSWGNKQYHQPSSGTNQAPAGTAPDGISILVMAGSQDPVQGGDLSDGRSGPEFAGQAGLDGAKGRAGGQQMPSHRVRSPLQSIHEDHEMGRRSGRASSTGDTLQTAHVKQSSCTTVLGASCIHVTFEASALHSSSSASSVPAISLKVSVDGFVLTCKLQLVYMQGPQRAFPAKFLTAVTSC